MTLATAKALLACNGKWKQLGRQVTMYMQEIGRKYPDYGFDKMFADWVLSNSPKPYKAFGNNVAKRISACGFIAKTEEELKILSKKIARQTHDHPEGIKGAEAIAMAIFLAQNGATKHELYERINKDYYDLNIKLGRFEYDFDCIPWDLKFRKTCQETVPLAILAFIKSWSFDGAIRNAVCFGKGHNSLAAITGGIAEAYYGIPAGMKNKAMDYLDVELRRIYREWEKRTKKMPPLGQFAFITKYIGKLYDAKIIDSFNGEFNYFKTLHPEYELDKYSEILEKNSLKWNASSMQSADVGSLDEQCALALITAVFRVDHFSQGTVDEFAKAGYIDKWLGRLKAIDDERTPTEYIPPPTEIKIDLFPIKGGTPCLMAVTEQQISIACKTADGGGLTYKYEFGKTSMLGDNCMDAMRDCLGADGWNDLQLGEEDDSVIYRYNLEAKFEDGRKVTHGGPFNRVHIPEKAFKKFIEAIQTAINVNGLGAILNLDGFMCAIRPGEVKYCGVKFHEGSKLYHYRTTDLHINIGDSVIVPVGRDDNLQVVTIKTVEFHRWDDTPFPLENTKEIRKLADDKINKPLLFLTPHRPPQPYLTAEIVDDDD
jgi:ADP-ribosylglycohydrolase